MKNNNTIGLVLLGVAILVWFGVVRAQVASFSELSKDLTAKNAELKSYETRVADVKKIIDAGATAQDRLRAYYLAMPKLSQVPEVMVMMEGLAAASGVTFSSANLGSPTGSEVPASVTFSGSIDSVANFLDVVNRNVRTIRVKSQTLAAESNGSVTVSMQLGFVYQGE